MTKFLVLGCHFSRSEKPFIYDANTNTYSQFDKDELFLDMYRSNDVVESTPESIIIRPFVKVSEKAENVKVFKLYLKDTVKPTQDQYPASFESTRIRDSLELSTGSQKLSKHVRNSSYNRASTLSANPRTLSPTGLSLTKNEILQTIYDLRRKTNKVKVSGDNGPFNANGYK